MNVFLSKYSNQFHAHIAKHVYQITNKFLEGIFLLENFYIKLGFYAFENLRETHFERILGYYKTLKPLAYALLCLWIL